MARSITDGDHPGLVVSRATAVSSYGSRIDQRAEECLVDLAKRFPDGFRMIQVTPPLLDLASKKIGMPVRVRRVESDDDNPVYGFAELGEKETLVRYRSDLNICWRRFTVAKELFHLYAGIAEDCGSRGSSAITQAAMEARRAVPSDGKQLEDEAAAFYLALEYLVPWCLRDQFNDLREAAATTYQIAKVFMIPRPFVEHLCDGGYAELSNRINRNI